MTKRENENETEYEKTRIWTEQRCFIAQWERGDATKESRTTWQAHSDTSPINIPNPYLFLISLTRGNICVFAKEIQFVQNVFTYKLLASCDKTEEHFKLENIWSSYDAFSWS